MRERRSENFVKEQIEDYLDIIGWFHFPILQGLGAYKGICDRIAIKDGKVLFIEVKGPKGRLSNHKKEFRKNIEAAGGIYISSRSYEDIARFVI